MVIYYLIQRLLLQKILKYAAYRIKNIGLQFKLMELYNKQKGRCAVTGVKLIPGKNMSLDHIKPKANKGSNDLLNLRWVTIEFNRFKYTFTDEELLELCKDILKVYEEKLLIQTKQEGNYNINESSNVLK